MIMAMLRMKEPRVLLCGGLLAAAALAVLYADAAETKPDPGDPIPIRQVADPYPVFNGVAIDPENNLVAMSDVNRKSILTYARTTLAPGRGITAPRHQVFGPRTNVGF